MLKSPSSANITKYLTPSIQNDLEGLESFLGYFVSKQGHFPGEGPQNTLEYPKIIQVWLPEQWLGGGDSQILQALF